MDPTTQYVYTVGEDKKFKVFDPNRNDIAAGIVLNIFPNLMIDVTVGVTSLTCLVCDKENKRAFVSNRSGQVYIYDISSVSELTFDIHV